MRSILSSSYLSVISVADGIYLATARPHPGRLVHDLGSPRAWLERVGPDTAVATLTSAALWCLAAWLAVALLAALATRLPGPAGRAAGATCRRMLPRVLYRVLAGGTGLGVIIAPVAATAGGLAPLPAPTWPTSSAASTPARAWPPPVRDVGSLPRLPTPALPTVAGPVTGHVVRAGESLWQIAAERLGPDAPNGQIATLWRSIYADNRRVIGPDPDLIRPGEHLILPPNPDPETRG